MEAAYIKLLCAKHLELWGPPLENAAAGGRRPWPYILRYVAPGTRPGKHDVFLESICGWGRYMTAAVNT